jgi:4-amino-4-deoxy-L-arabinose transferase-like glycosyltransferase
MNLRRRPLLWLVLLTILADVGLALPGVRYASAFILLWVLPGLGWAGLLSSTQDDRTGDNIAIGLCLGMGTVASMTLLLHYVPGPLTLPTLLIAANGLIAILGLLGVRGVRLGSPSLPGGWGLVAGSFVLLGVAAFRLAYLGYSEFQGDEGIVMMRAARAIAGDDQQLFYHQKGPVEALVPIATWTLSGRISEWQARLPFAFAGLLGVAATCLIGRRWFGGWSGLIAGLLLAINGYFVGFGRVVQYQSIVLAATTTAMLALLRWAEAGGRRWLFVGAALLAFGLLAHYDAALALPAAAYLVGRRLWRDRSRWRAHLIDVLTATVPALGLLALFYLPFVGSPSFSKTFGYLSAGRIGTGGPLYNNLVSSLPLATFYNSTYYLIVVVGLLLGLSFRPFRRWALLIPAACYLLLAVAYVVLRPRATVWVGPLLASLLIAIVASPFTSPSHRAGWLWFGVPFLFYYFLVWDPRTHVLNVFPGAVLLAGAALEWLVGKIGGKKWRTVAQALALAVFALLAYYPYSLFIRHDPEIQRTWPEHQPVAYWRPEHVPLFGYFGYPYRAGWKVVGVLAEEGILSGVYASNEEYEVADWYVRGLERTYCPGSEWFLMAQDVQDEVPSKWDEVKDTYGLWGEIKVGGRVKLEIYRRNGTRTVPNTYRAEDYVARFDAHSTPSRALPAPPDAYVPSGHTLGDKVQLLGYRLDASDARPGGDVRAVYYWKALEPMETVYQVFNHVYDGTMWGQQDGTPGCDILPTVLWEPGQIVRDEYTIRLDPAMLQGEVPLLVGMYDLDTGDRLQVLDADGVLVGDAIPLATVRVE